MNRLPDKPPVFVVNCSVCGKVQAASVADGHLAHQIQSALRFLHDAEAYNNTRARRLAHDETIPEYDGWCHCKDLPKTQSLELGAPHVGD